MAILKGIKVNIHVDGSSATATDYPVTENPVVQDSVIITYVESTLDSLFSICGSLLEHFQSPDASLDKCHELQTQRDGLQLELNQVKAERDTFKATEERRQRTIKEIDATEESGTMSSVTAVDTR
jgi:hypothetical protein